MRPPSADCQVPGWGGIYKRIINTDHLFESHRAKGNVIVVNDLPNATAVERRTNTNLVQAVYTSERLEDVPACRCGAEYGADAEGTTCLECGTVVARLVEDSTGIVTWLRAPKGVKALINPTMLIVLQDNFALKFGQKSVVFDFVRWMMDTQYTITSGTKRMDDIMSIVTLFNERGFKRGYNAFIEQFDDIIEVFSDHPVYRYADELTQREWHEFLATYRDCLFVQHVPSPPPSLLVLEVTDTLTYRSESTTEAVNAIRQLLSIDTKEVYRNSRNERLAMLAMFGMAKFSTDYVSHTERGKRGMWRMHIYALRLQTSSFRGVIIPLYEAHRPDDAIMPWGAMVKCMYFHLANMLDKRGYTYPQIVKKLALGIGFYDAEIEMLLHELIEQFKNGGEFRGPIAVMVRFPTLGTPSIIPFHVVGFYLPHEGNAIGFPSNNVKSMNADFDGDKLSGWFTLDFENSRRWLYTFGVHNNVVNPNDYRKASGYFPLTRPLTVSLNGYLNEDNDPTKARMEYMQLIAEEVA